MLVRDLLQRPWLHRLAPWLVIAGVIVGWLWPITLAGRMPVGGDVTSFFLPIMAYYRQALIDGRVPLWNELWGYGFPFLAESQSGVFYPPHLILFRLFQTETAYSINIVLHHVLAGWFAYWCGREFGLRRWGATLAGLVFAGNGFFIIHFPHQWSYTTGCWMPLAVALAWRAVKGQGSGVRGQQSETDAAKVDLKMRLTAALGLALVLAVQMLAGHFQLAFYTQVVVLLIGLVCTVQALWRPLSVKPARYRPWGSRAAIIGVALAVAAAFGLAAVQLLPTRELIRIAVPDGRDFEYLSGFANTPLHLVSYLLPTLFHVNPLWRPVAWDPFHTSPEECFSYVGLLPLCLALGAAWRWRREPRVRLWVLMVAITLVLSLGPYTPLFRGLMRLPGFDGFRAASRWSVATALFLALLAGRGLDGVRAAQRLRRWLRGLVLAFVAIGGFSVGAFWILIDAGGNPNNPGWTWHAVDCANRAWSAIGPWDDSNALPGAAMDAHERRFDMRIIRGLAQLGYRLEPKPGEPAWPFGQRGIRQFTLGESFSRITLEELLPPIVLLTIVCGCLCWVAGARRLPRLLVLALVAVDLGVAGWLRPTDFAPRGRLVQQSSVLGFLAEHARGERVTGPHRNLPMLAGTATESYRTVDIPMITQTNRPDPAYDRQAWNERVWDRLDMAWSFWGGPLREGERETVVTDPVLGRIDHGRQLVRAFPQATTSYSIRGRDASQRSRAWFWDAQDDPDRFRDLIEFAGQRQRRPSSASYAWLILSPGRPVKQIRAEPECADYEIDATGPGAVMVGELGYPGWEARLTGPAGTEQSETDGSQVGCRVVRVPAAGKYRLELAFRSRPFELGRTISLVALAAWLVALAATLRWRR